MKHASTLALVTAALAASAAGPARAGNPEHSFSWSQELQRTQTAAPAANSGTQSRNASAQADDRHLQRFSLQRVAPDQEAFDPTSQMDPRIGRWQDMDAPN